MPQKTTYKSGWFIDCVLYAISLLSRCLKFVMLNCSVFVDLGLSVEEDDEICLGSKLKVGIILEKSLKLITKSTLIQ